MSQFNWEIQRGQDEAGRMTFSGGGEAERVACRLQFVVSGLPPHEPGMFAEGVGRCRGGVARASKRTRQAVVRAVQGPKVRSSQCAYDSAWDRVRRVPARPRGAA